VKTLARWSLALALSAGSLGAQTPLETKTLDLRHLKPKEAVKLLSPYVVNAGGGVFDVAENIAVVTIRDTPDNIARMERVLAKYDHTPATIRLVFQLIEADTGARLASGKSGLTPVSLDLDSTLRSVLKFPSYRLLAQGVATAGEFSHVSQQLAQIDANFGYLLSADVGTIRLGGGSATGAPGQSVTGTVHLNVSLRRSGAVPIRGQAGVTTVAGGEGIMSTGLDVPLGHMVVLGTAATKTTGVALILTVRPELLPVRP
jgi:hypothetical protein